jgi:branched-chain amino acid transport system permease protein
VLHGSTSHKGEVKGERRLARFRREATGWLNQGRRPQVFSIVTVAVGSLLVYANPRALVSFWLFLAAVYVSYTLATGRKFKTVLFAVVLLVVMPILGLRNIFYLELAFQISVFAALALGLNIVVGFAGLLDLGYVAFYAVGAYLWGFFGSQQPFLLNAIPGTAPPNTPFFLPANAFYLFMILGIGVAALTGLLLGTPVLRLRGDYLAIVTLGFGEVIRVLANNLDKPINLTNGPQGISPIQRPPIPESVQQALNLLLSPFVGHSISLAEFYNLFFYLLTLGVVGVIIVVTQRLDDSRTGRAWAALRDDELAAVSMGVPKTRLKLMAFAAGASFAGIMGVIMAANRTFVSPESFSFMQSIGVLSMVILGGIGSIPGVIVGAAVVQLLTLQVLPGISLVLGSMRGFNPVLDPTKYQRMIFGLILVVMMIYRPAGLIPAARRKRELERADEEPAVVEAEDEG